MFRHPLFLLLLIFLALGAALIARVPLDKSPDEAAHWQYIEYLAANHALPVFRGEVPPAPGYEFHQPPLYYALAAPGWAILPAGAQNYWARLVSLLCGAATLIFIWKSARLLFADDRTIAILATAFAALWPLHLAVSSGANNDALAGLWSAALFWCGTRVTMRGSNLRDAALMGALIGLGALTKNTVLVVGFVALVALWVAPSSEKSPSRAIQLLVALATMTIIAGPWWARNIFVYGDPLAFRAFSEAATKGTPGLAQLPFDMFTYLVYWRGMAWLLLMTAWGFFGGVNTALDKTSAFSPDGPVMRQLWLLPFVAVFALAPLAALVGWRKLRGEAEWTPAQKLVLRFWSIGFVLVFLAWLQFVYGHFSGGQARYLHAALLPMSVLLAAGWRGLWSQNRALNIASCALAALLLTMTLLNLLVWKTLV